MFSKSWLIIFSTNSTHLDGHVETSSHHRTNWHVGNDHIGQKNFTRLVNWGWNYAYLQIVVWAAFSKFWLIISPANWWLFWLIWSFPMYQLALWWLKVPTWSSRWVKLAGKMISQDLLNVAILQYENRHIFSPNLTILVIFFGWLSHFLCANWSYDD